MTSAVDRIPAAILQVWDATATTGLGQLAGVSSMTASEVFSEVGSIELTAPRDTVGMSLLDTDDDRQLCLRLAGAAPLWFVIDDDDSTWVSDDPASEPVHVVGRTLHALLDEALVIPADGIGEVPAEWAWEDATPGQVVADLWAAAASRGLLQNLALSGTATLDASGVAWPDTLTVTHRAGTSLLAVLTALRDAGLVEYRFGGDGTNGVDAGRTLELHRPGGDLDRVMDGGIGAGHGPEVVLRPRRDVISAPLQRSRRSVATAAIVEGTGGATTRRTQTLTGRREREAYVSETSLDETALDAAGDLYLAAHAGADVQYTHDLTDGDDSPRPWIDYRPGDRVVTIAAGPQPVRRRVLQIALALDEDGGVKVSLELGSILRTAEETMARKLARLAPGDGAVS